MLDTDSTQEYHTSDIEKVPYIAIIIPGIESISKTSAIVQPGTLKSCTSVKRDKCEILAKEENQKLYWGLKMG